MKKLVVPKFRTEKEEAQWWDSNMHIVQANLLEAMRKGTAKPGGPARVIAEKRLDSKNITIRMRLADLEKARRLADRRGIGYQTYMKMLLREALDREGRRAGRRL